MHIPHFRFGQKRLLTKWKPYSWTICRNSSARVGLGGKRYSGDWRPRRTSSGIGIDKNSSAGIVPLKNK